MPHTNGGFPLAQTEDKMSVRDSWNIPGLLARLEKSRSMAEDRYIELLFGDDLQAAADQLHKIDLIDLHIAKVEEL
jgi:hypothetical protein